MNTAVAISALVFGGWVLPDQGSAPTAPGPPPLPREAAAPPQNMQRPQDQGMRRPPSEQLRGQQPGYRGRSAAPQAGIQQQPIVPFAPTDPSGAGALSPWSAPTDLGPTTYDPGDPTQPSDAGLRPMQPMTPSPLSRSRSYGRLRASRPSYRGYSAYAARQLSPQTKALKKAASHSPFAVSSRKPFSGYQAAPVISPYMDLYSTDTDLGTLDNYYRHVKRNVDQRNYNQQFGTQIRGLNRTTSRQGSAIRTIGRDTMRMQGIADPQRFMNARQYYPGLGQ